MPDPVLVDVDIANRALMRIGEAPIQALDEDTDVAGQVAAVYGDVVDGALSLYAWKFARRTSKLDAVAPPNGALSSGDGWYFPDQTPQGAFNGWRNAFNFPADALSGPLGLFRAWPQETARDFVTEGQIVYASCGALWGTFVRRLSPDQWIPTFRLAVITWLQAELAVPITHDKDLADNLRAQALGTPQEGGRGGLMGRAIAMDAAQGGSIASAVQNDPLTMARYQGAGNWWGD